MDDGAFLWACDPQPMAQVGMFNGADNQGGLLCHAESPYPQYWGSEAWAPSRPDEIHDIATMSSSLVDAPAILSFEPGVLNNPVPEDDLRFPQHEQWTRSLRSSDLYPTQDMQELLNNPFLQFNSSTLGMPHLAQEYDIHKSLGTITSMSPSRQVTSTTAPSSQYGGPSMVPNNRAVAGMSQYGSPPVVPNSMGMFAPTIPRGGIVSTSGLGGGMNSNPGLMHFPRRHNTPSLAPTTGGDITASDVGSAVPGVSTFSANQKSSASVLMPLADSSHMHKMDEEPKISSFNPGPYVPAPKQQHDQQDSTRMWGDGSLGKSSSVPIPNMGLRKQQAVSNSPVTSMGFDHMQAMSNSSPVTSMGFDPRHAISNSSPVTSMGFDHRHPQPVSKSSITNFGMEQRHQQSLSNSSPATNMGLTEQRRQQAMSNSSPVTHFGIEQRPKPPTGSSPITIEGFEPKQQHQRLPSSSPISGMRQQQCISSPTPSFDQQQRQQPAASTSPPLSNLSFESHQPPHQQPVSSPAPVSARVFEPMRQQTNLTSNPTGPNLSRQQPPVSNPRSTMPDSGDSAPKWPALRMGGSTGLPGSEKAPMMMQQPETGTLKCALPRNSSANTSPAVNPANKRPLYPDDTKSQGGSMTKKPLNKWQGAAGCSRLEEISNAAHQKVTQTTSGRALGPALNTNLKPRARQGSANDPQSIAARVRRERISERLKVLQALIPNGDKVDMVTMLEKAINYVRCLELQIRMLKNDSLWPKALGPLPNTLQELLELAGPDFQDESCQEEAAAPEKTTTKTAPEVIEMDGHQPSADKE